MEQHIAGVIEEYSRKEVVQDYLEFQKHPSVWSALFPERESYEKFYSRMIRYFLSPTENHGLGEAFADILVERFSESVCKLNTENEEHERFTGAETEALGSNIDILYRSAQRNRLIVIEAKMNSADHSHIEKGKNGEEKIISQLDKYFNAVVNKSGGYQDNYFIYLTINGDAPTQEVESKDSWVCMSYKKLHEDLDKLQKIADERLAGQQNLSAVLSLISDFQQDISRKIRQYAKDMDAAASSVLSEPGVRDKFKEWGERQKEIINQDQAAGLGFKDRVVELCVERYGLDVEIAETCFNLLTEFAIRNKQVQNSQAAALIEKISACLAEDGNLLTPNQYADVKKEFADFAENADNSPTEIHRTKGRGLGLNIRSPYTFLLKEHPDVNFKERNRKNHKGEPERAYVYIAGAGPKDQFPVKNATTQEIIDALTASEIPESDWEVGHWLDPAHQEDFDRLIKAIKVGLTNFYASHRNPPQR